MMLNLFTTFDPSTSNSLSLNWLSILSPIFFLPNLFWNVNSRFIQFFHSINFYLSNEFLKNFKPLNYKNFFIFLSMFWFILFNNIFGLAPYIFTATSHLTISLTFALTNWLIFMIFGWSNKINNMFCHLVPLGTPIYLSSFMVIIETISNIIRPLTLSIRLSANMIAGHLLLTLLTELSESTYYIFILTFPIIIILMSLEIAVSIIQSYVFTTLISLYLNEI